MPRNIWTTDNEIYLGFAVSPAKPQSHRSILDEDWTVETENLHRYPNPDDPANRGDRHILTIGPNGSGKTRRLLIPNLFLLKNWSIVVVDIKGELAAATAAYRASQPGHRVVVIDPFGVVPKTYPKLAAEHPFLLSNGFNPVGALDPQSEEFPDDALALAEAIIRVEGNEPHWSQSAQDLIAALIMYVRFTNGRSGSLADVRAFLGQTGKEFCDTIRLVMATGVAHRCDELTIKAARFSDLKGDNKELNSIISTALTQTRWLDSRPIKADLAKGGFDFGSLKRTPTTVYLVLPPRYLATHSTWLRVLVTSSLMPLLRSVEDAEVPVLFMLDEFAQLGQMPVIENNIALMRGYGIKLWPVFQDFAQARTLYKERWESFVGNAGVVQSFAPQDVTTRKYLSDLSGQRIYWVKTAGTSSGQTVGGQTSQNTGVNQSRQPIQGPHYWPQGLGEMAAGQSVLYLRENRARNARAWFPDPEDEEDTLGLRALLRDARNREVKT